IVRANPSLRDDPDKIIVGKQYVIPSAADVASSTPAPTASASAAPASASHEIGEYWYTVKEHDTLYGIAKTQLNNATAVTARQELNADILHGSTNLKPGMKLRLPSKPLTVANSN